MKFRKILAGLAAASVCALAVCSGCRAGAGSPAGSAPASGTSGGPDAGVLFREAKTAAETMKSCEATFSSSLVFTAGEKRHSFRSGGSAVFTAEPFALRSVRSSQEDGLSGRAETYTVAENGSLWFYGRGADGAWRKAEEPGLDTSPLAQIEILGLLNSAEQEKYVRETQADSRPAHKIELRLKSEVLRSTIETVAAASGIGSGSRTLVQALLESAPPVYAYAYIDARDGLLLRLELDAADTVDRLFRGIDGSSVKIRVSECSVSGGLSKVNGAPPVRLPDEVQKAAAVQAQG
jgi:hypothetical protein